MRLINVETLKLEEFFDDAIPPYAILSHTWGNDNEEVSFRNVEEGKIEKSGIRPIKFEGCCKQAKKDNLRYAWIDTCCIDKANSVELSEAINSMFQWYRRASICYTYLSDVSADDNPRNPRSKFFSSRWFERGWTLQELLAPEKLCFYNSEWCYLGTKRELSTIIEKITGIPRLFILGIAKLCDASVAQRMSWAAKRVTKRKEDNAYCLLGIFDVMMPMIYGEGGQAFSRLQQEIMRETRDDSILAWGLNLTGPTPSNSTEVISGGVLAAAPSDFVNCGHIVSREHYNTPINSFEISGGSLQVHLPLFTTSAGETFGLLKCGPGHNAEQVVGIPLNIVMSREPFDEYVRPLGCYSVLLPKVTSGVLTKLIHIRKERHSKALAEFNRQYWFYVEESVETDLELIDVEPRARWHKDNAMIATATESDGNVIQRTSTRFRHRKEGSSDFVVVLEFEVQKSQMQARCHVMISSRDTPLENVARRFIYMRQGAFGKQSASNGILNLYVTLGQELVAAQPMFVVRLAAMPSSPEVTVDATFELRLLDLKLELVTRLREEDRIRLKAKGLGQQMEKEMAKLEPMKRQLEMVEEKLRKLNEERRLLVDGLTKGSEQIDQLTIRGNEIGQRQRKLSKWTLQTQQRLNTLLKNNLDVKGAPGDGYEAVIKLLLATEVDAESMVNDGPTLLSWAAANGYEGVVKLLLEKRADVAATDENGLTPLYLASSQGHIDIVKLLLEKGADITAIDKERKTPLHLASSQGHIDIVKLLLEKGADIAAVNKDGLTPLHLASSQGHIDIVKLLLEKGADIAAVSKDGLTPLYLASYQGHMNAVELLLEKGADIAAIDKNRRTPLHLAYSQEHVDVAKLLLKEKQLQLDATVVG
jgi:ankyrin repeat protein